MAESIAQRAAGLVLGVRGVNRLSGSPSAAKGKHTQAKRPRRGVRVAIKEGAIRIDIHIMVDFGKSIPDIARQIQKETKDYIDGEYVDYRLSAVNVQVDGFQFDQDSLRHREQSIKALDENN